MFFFFWSSLHILHSCLYLGTFEICLYYARRRGRNITARSSKWSHICGDSANWGCVMHASPPRPPWTLNTLFYYFTFRPRQYKLASVSPLLLASSPNTYLPVPTRSTTRHSLPKPIISTVPAPTLHRKSPHAHAQYRANLGIASSPWGPQHPNAAGGTAI